MLTPLTITIIVAIHVVTLLACAAWIRSGVRKACDNLAIESSSLANSAYRIANEAHQQRIIAEEAHQIRAALTPKPTPSKRRRGAKETSRA